MSNENNVTYNEIITQTQAWEKALQKTLDSTLPDIEQYEQVLFTGCGSTYYLSLSAASLCQEIVGVTARALPAGELLLNSQIVLPERKESTEKKTLLVAISRSGTTSETVKAVDKFKKDRRGDVIVISNYDEKLSRFADINIVIPEGQEISVAQTRSFASMHVAVTALCARLAGRNDLLNAMQDLFKTGERIIRSYEGLAKTIGENLEYDRFYFLGSGIRYGLACEVNLKMKEMTLTHSEPFHFLEFRHGPMSMVNTNTVVVGLVSEKNAQHENKVLAEMKVMGATILTLGENEGDIQFSSGIPEPVRAVLYLPVLQMMAYYRSLAKGLNPDRPKNLTAVVKLDFA